MTFNSSNYSKSTLQTGIKENSALLDCDQHADLFSFAPASKDAGAIFLTGDYTNSSNVELSSTRGINADSRFDPDSSFKSSDVFGDHKNILSDSFYSARGRGNSSHINLLERYECDLRRFGFGKGPRLPKISDKHAGLNISSSSAVLGNNEKHFGDEINPFDLPSPIENDLTNPLETQLLANVRKSETGSSGYASCSQSESEYSKHLSRNVSSYNYQPTDSFNANHETTTAFCSVFSDLSKWECNPIGSSGGRYSIEMKSKYPEQDRTFLKQESIRSPDIFTTAIDSPYLTPKYNEDLIFERGSFVQDINVVPISNTTSMSLFDSERYENSYIPSSFHTYRTTRVSSNRNYPQKAYQKAQNSARPNFGNLSERMDVLCKFCVTNKEPREECRHRLKDELGLVTCPVLYTYICDICGATESYAHTRKHCPRRKEYMASTRKDTSKLIFEKWRNGIVTIS